MNYTLTTCINFSSIPDEIAKFHPDEIFKINDFNFNFIYQKDVYIKNDLIEIFGESYIKKQIYKTYKELNDTKIKMKHFEVTFQKKISEEEAFYFKIKCQDIWENVDLKFIETKD